VSKHYQVQLKIGSRTVIDHIEASSFDMVLSLYETLSVAKVTEIREVVYSLPDATNIPPDDFNYFTICKTFVRDSSTGKSQQVILHYVKPNKHEDDVFSALKEFTKLDGASFDSTITTLFKK
jgi:hypothetical protein